MVGYNAGVKEPPYSTILSDGAYEVRQYPSIVTVNAFAAGDFNQSQDQSFQKLFDYISGNNAASAEIPMTAPVLMKGKGTEIPMTAPVFMAAQKDGWTMSFVLPGTYTRETAPKPLDSTLTLDEIKNVKYAAIRFSGFFTDANFEEKKTELQSWIAAKNLKAIGPAMRAGYNPPWTLPPLRRNEVLIPVE